MIAGNAGQSGKERLARFFREHAKALRAYILAMVRRPDVADDLVQEVFQRTGKPRRYRDEGHERAYLLKIADRLVVDRSRRTGREINVDTAAWNEIEPTAETDIPLDELTALRREQK